MVSHNISVDTILCMTANQALLLIGCTHFYGCPENYFLIVQIYTYSYNVDQIFGATPKLFGVFFNTKPKYVDDLTLDL